MQKFVEVVIRYRKFKLSDPAHIISEDLKTVDDLQRHGFDVSAIKAGLEDLRGRKVEIDRLLGEKEKINENIEKLNAEAIGAYIKELQERLDERKRARKIRLPFHFVRHEISKGKLDIANLHFSPFKGFEEDERERLATVYMDIYSELVGTIKLIDSMDISMDILAATLKKVEELQRYGFDVTAIEVHLEKLQECHKMKKDLEKHDMELLIVNGEIKELRVKLDESVTAKKNNNNEIIRLDSNLHLVEHKILEVELYLKNMWRGSLILTNL
ncbi:Agenet-like domain-containing protein [Artemisia annua]|uniref:Agenet-like domain-containing protein n=1 Tax=Artemisia annua TaxID=35608 RepID=A0A2U1NY39_ARTAN|nr:Agenet-like domain-containing protein [Artemisia annua]